MDSVKSLLGQASTALRHGDLERASSQVDRAAELEPRHCGVLLMQGVIADRRGNTGLAASLMAEACQQCPDDPRNFFNHGTLLYRLRRFPEARQQLLTALQLKPDHVPALGTLGACLTRLGQLGQATAVLKKALRIEKRSAEAWNNLGDIYRLQGNIEAACDAYRTVLRLRPILPATASNLLLTLCYSSRVSPAELFQAHLQWRDHCPAPATDIQRPSAPHTTGKIRLGYLSPDFRAHSVANFLEPILREHDRDRFAVYCYSNVAVPDAVTRRMETLSDHWQQVSQLDDAALAARISADRIDILVDLAGHTAGNRLAVFLHRCAPVQISYLGYPATTGLQEMDWRITDSLADPDGAEAMHSERLLRLDPGFLCYQPPADAPAAGPPPALRDGTIRFASFNNLSKVSGPVFDCWSQILHRVEASQLVLKSMPLGDHEVQQRVLGEFSRRGIAPQRISFIPYTASKNEHLACYNEVDIALDTFPYNGTTTTCEALFMGVPVICLAGDRHAGRVGLSILSTLGMADLVADSTTAYTDTAAGLATNLAELQARRAGLRDRLVESDLCDGAGFTRRLEAAYLKTLDAYPDS